MGVEQEEEKKGNTTSNAESKQQATKRQKKKKIVNATRILQSSGTEVRKAHARLLMPSSILIAHAARTSIP